MINIDHWLMIIFFIIASYLWLTMPDNYDTVEYHRKIWLNIWTGLKELFAEIKAGKHKTIATQFAAFYLMVFLAAVVIFIITGLAYWLKS